jgi:hypothetical protein
LFAQVEQLQQRVVQLQQELAAEVAAAAAGAAQIKELNELNVKLSGHNNQQQVAAGRLPLAPSFSHPASENSLLGGSQERRQRA